jgi:aspartate/methionine/tyrosine aminotransferase
MAAYEMGYENASAPIVGPTNESRNILRAALDEAGYRYIIGKGYYAFIDLGPWIQAAGWEDSIPMGEYLANEFGLAVVPGAFNSPAGNDWVRFSYAQTPERTRGAAQRLNEALKNLEK